MVLRECGIKVKTCCLRSDKPRSGYNCTIFSQLYTRHKPYLPPARSSIYPTRYAPLRSVTQPLTKRDTQFLNQPSKTPSQIGMLSKSVRGNRQPKDNKSSTRQSGRNSDRASIGKARRTGENAIGQIIDRIMTEHSESAIEIRD